jgi:hypothetical protein
MEREFTGTAALCGESDWVGMVRLATWRCQARLVWLCVVLLTLGARVQAAAPGETPTDSLLRLVAPDAAVVLTIEGLRDQVRALGSSRLAADIWQLPTVQAWPKSEKYQQFEHSRARIEAVLEVNLTDLRDELLGDAALLALRLPPQEPADSSLARGVLLFQARDHALLERLIRVINATQTQNGELASLGDRTRRGTTYHVREFPAESGRMSEWYVAYPDGTFAFSNSEFLIQAVIDRKTAAPAAEIAATDGPSPRVGPGLGDLPAVRAVQRRLSRPALARVFVNPRQIRRLLAAAPRPTKPGDARLMAMVERYLAAVDFAGASLVWNDRSIEAQMVEILDPAKLDPWLRRWARGAGPRDPSLDRVPSTALAVASGHIDPLALFDAVSQLVPDEDGPSLANVETVLTGLLLGQDLRTRVLPRLGPGILAYIDLPSDSIDLKAAAADPALGSSWPFPLVVVVSLGKEVPVASRPTGSPPEQPNAQEATPVPVAAALENALRTILALTALDGKRNHGRSRIRTSVVAGTAVTTLEPPLPFAYAVDGAGSRAIAATSADSLARYLESSTDAKAGERFRQLHARSFPGDQTFFCVDLDAVTRLAGRQHDRLIQALAARKERPPADIERDLNQVLGMARLFEAAFLTSRFEPDAAAVERRVGLILHGPP